jgi:hypothetical protein
MAANFTPVLITVLAVFGAFMLAMAYAQWTVKGVDLDQPE